MDQNGTPTVQVSATGEFAGKAAELSQVSTPAVSFSQMIRGLFAAATSAIAIVVDGIGRKMFAGPADIADMWATGSIPNQLHFEPENGQEGRSLKWNASTSAGTVPAAIKTALDAQVAAVKPALSVESLTSKLLNAIPEAEAGRCAIAINQAAGSVDVLYFASSAARETWVNGHLPELTDPSVAVVTFSADNVDPEAPTPLMFEGGPISTP